MINVTLATSGSTLTTNQLMAMNAVRCAFVSGFYNSWYLIAAAYYAALQFGQQKQVTDLLDQGYPYICTCNQDVANLSKYFGATVQSSKYFSSCDESSL